MWGWGTREDQAEAESRECKVFQKSESLKWRNQTVGHWFSFFAWPWRAPSEFRMKQDTCGSAQTGVLFTAPTQLPWRHQATVLSKHTPGSAAYFDSGKWKVRNLSGLLFTLNWSDQWKESKQVYFVFHSSLVVKQFNGKQIPLTHKYPKHKAAQSSSQFCSHGIESSIKARYSPSVGSRSRSAWWGEMADRVPFLHIVTTIKLQSISLTFKASGPWKF